MQEEHLPVALGHQVRLGVVRTDQLGRVQQIHPVLERTELDHPAVRGDLPVIGGVPVDDVVRLAPLAVGPHPLEEVVRVVLGRVRPFADQPDLTGVEERVREPVGEAHAPARVAGLEDADLAGRPPQGVLRPRDGLPVDQAQVQRVPTADGQHVGVVSDPAGALQPVQREARLHDDVALPGAVHAVHPEPEVADPESAARQVRDRDLGVPAGCTGHGRCGCSTGRGGRPGAAGRRSWRVRSGGRTPGVVHGAVDVHAGEGQAALHDQHIAPGADRFDDDVGVVDAGGPGVAGASREGPVEAVVVDLQCQWGVLQRRFRVAEQLEVPALRRVVVELLGGGGRVFENDLVGYPRVVAADVREHLGQLRPAHDVTGVAQEALVGAGRIALEHVPDVGPLGGGVVQQEVVEPQVVPVVRRLAPQGVHDGGPVGAPSVVVHRAVDQADGVGPQHARQGHPGVLEVDALTEADPELAAAAVC